MHDLLLLIRLHVRVIAHVVRGLLLLEKAIRWGPGHVLVDRKVLMEVVVVLLLVLLLHLRVLLIHFVSEVVYLRRVRGAFGAFGRDVVTKRK